MRKIAPPPIAPPPGLDRVNLRINNLLCEITIPENIEHYVSSGTIVKVLSLLVFLDRDFIKYI